MTNANTIRQAISARPFRPFTVFMADQREFRIPHPEHALVSPGGRTLVVFTDDETAHHLDMLLISGIDVPTPAGPERGPTQN
jgi:hypothetical protein